jgi:hypothetical protein
MGTCNAHGALDGIFISTLDLMTDHFHRLLLHTLSNERIEMQINCTNNSDKLTEQHSKATDLSYINVR